MSVLSIASGAKTGSGGREMGEGTHNEIKKWQKRYRMIDIRLAFWGAGLATMLWLLYLDIKFSYVPMLTVMDWQLAAVFAIATTPLEMGYMWLMDRKKEWARTDKVTKAFFKYVVGVLIIYDAGTNMFGVGMDAVEKGAGSGWAILLGFVVGGIMAFPEIPIFALYKQIIDTLSDRSIAKQHLIHLGVMGDNEEKIFGGGWND